MANHHHHDIIETSIWRPRPPDMEIIRSVSSFEKIRTISAQILVYQEHILAKFMCFAKFMEVVLEVVEVMEVVHYLYIAAQSFNFHHQA